MVFELSISVIITFLIAVTRHLTRGNLRDKEIILISNQVIQLITKVKTWQQKCEGAGL